MYAGDEADVAAATGAEEGAGVGADEGRVVRERADGGAGPEVEPAGSDMRGRDVMGRRYRKHQFPFHRAQITLKSRKLAAAFQ